MVEGLSYLPCALDPREDCPPSCSLRDFASRIILSRSLRLEETPATIARQLRMMYEQMNDRQIGKYMTNTITNLPEGSAIEDCANHQPT